MQIIRMAVCLGLGLLASLKASASIPVINGASAAPLDSIKYWIARAELRTSGNATSFTVDVTLADEMGINKAVIAIMIANKVFSPEGMFSVRKSRIAPIVTPIKAT